MGKDGITARFQQQRAEPNSDPAEDFRLFSPNESVNFYTDSQFSHPRDMC